MKKCNIGGQAVMVGVMMRSATGTALAVRQTDGSIAAEYHNNSNQRKKGSFPTWPVVRGVYAFCDSLVSGMKIISRSAEIVGGEFEEEPSKFEIWLSKKLGKSVMDVAIYIAIVLAVVLSVGLFIALPALLVGLIPFNNHPVWESLCQGLIRLCIFLGYLGLISRMKDVRRLFMYHGAEHKTIACYEAELELTPENAEKCSRFHPRCGTNFMFLVMAVSIVFFACITALTNLWLPEGLEGSFIIRFATRLLFLPLVAGLSYEVLKFAAKSDNLFCRVVRAPGLALQRLTTKEPDRSMLEVAITAFKLVLDPPDHDINFKRVTPKKVEDKSDATAEDAPANTEGGAEERDDAADSASECPERVEAAPVTIDDIIEPEEASEQTDGETQDEDDSSPLDWSEPEES